MVQYDAVVPKDFSSAGPGWVLRRLGDMLSEEGFDRGIYSRGSPATSDDGTFSYDATPIGYINFAETSLNTIPSPSELKAWIKNNPNAPVVLNTDSGVEVPHLVLGQFYSDRDSHNNELLIGADVDDAVIIRLFTVGCDKNGTRFDLRSSHFKNGAQWEGVEITDWSMVHFHAVYKDRGTTLDEIYKSVYSYIRSRYLIKSE